MNPQFILASGSPRRAEMLARLGYRFAVQPADIDESPRAAESPEQLVSRLARAKAAAVDGRPALGADTIVVCDGQVFGKPAGPEQGQAMLLKLADRWHEVLTAVCLRAADTVHECLSRTRVRFGPISAPQARAYWASGEPADKAGAYAIQGLAGAFVAELAGSYSGVVGLPLVETLELLRAEGIAPPALEPAA